MRNIQMPPLTKEEEAQRDAFLTLLEKELRGEDDLGLVLRSQILIEKILEDIILKLSINSQFFKDLSPRYEKKIILVLMLGGLTEDYRKPLEALGRIRNGFAHDPQRKLTQKDVGDFLGSFTGRVGDALQKLLKENRIRKEDKKACFSHCVLCLHARMSGALKFAEYQVKLKPYLGVKL